jgi:hypothetical protein
VVSSSGCDNFGFACTLVYVAHGVTLDFEGDLVEGDHVLQVVADGRQLALDVRLTPNEPGCGDGVAACRDEEDGMSLDEEFTTLPRISYLDEDRGGPDIVELTLLRDGVVIHSATLRPDYRIEEPNGNGCGEVIVARETVIIAAP